MIKAILFDFDGVLTVDKTGSQSIINYLAEKGMIPLNIIKASYYKYNAALLSGETTHQDIWENFCNDIGKSLNFSILQEAFQQTKLDIEMITLIKELKKPYLIGMVTDNKCDRIDMVLDFNKLRSYFDVVSISAVIHSGKSERTIFDTTIKKLNVSPEECIFIDNTAENLKIPKQMGMSTILFDDENRNFMRFKEQLYAIIKNMHN
jgi:HAD superfamily hydrolase (TIGR01509 family)